MTLFIGSIFVLPQDREDARQTIVTMAYMGILRQNGGVFSTVQRP